jgi:hypothetical protein
MPTKTEDDGFGDTYLLYLGLRLNHKGQKSYAYVVLPSADAMLPAEHSINDERWYTKDIMKHATPGSLWRAQGKVTPEGTTIRFGGHYVGRYADSARVARWQAENQATREKYELESTKSKKLRERLDYEAMDPIRLAYQKASSLERGLILANAVRFITSHKGAL